jgi:hypothetical protein
VRLSSCSKQKELWLTSERKYHVKRNEKFLHHIRVGNILWLRHICVSKD